MAKKQSLKQRMEQKKKELASKGKGGYIMKQKEEGTIRVRILPVGEDNEFVHELTTFYLGNTKELGEVVSPATFGEACALMETYQEFKNSKDDDDLEIAKKLVPRNKYVIPILMYKDKNGKEVDEENTNKLLAIATSVYNQIIDLYLDEDEWGDMTDPKKGYDIKITRTGKGQFDTQYSVSACKNTPLPKEYQKKVVDLEEMVKQKVATYEETLEKKNTFLGSSDDDDDEDETPRKSKLKKKTSKSSKDRSSKSSKDKTLTKSKSGIKKRKRDI